MVTKDVLNQYYDLKQEEIEVRNAIDVLRGRIERYEDQMNELEHVTVIDKVKGGYGGIQSFYIEGYDERDMAMLRVRLLRNRQRLAETLELKENLKDRIHEQIADVERFINGINDSFIRRIIYYRFVEHQPWNRVADKIGGGNTEDGVKKAFYRFMDA